MYVLLGQDQLKGTVTYLQQLLPDLNVTLQACIVIKDNKVIYIIETELHFYVSYERLYAGCRISEWNLTNDKKYEQTCTFLKAIQ